MSRLEEILYKDGRLVYKIKGVSMLPMLRQNRDVVVIRVPEGRLKKYDVALYRRGTAYVLHRVIRVEEHGYLIRGDNTYAPEKVPDGDVIGVLERFTRNGKTHTVDEPVVRLYARFWHGIYPARHLYIRVRRKLGRAARKLGLR